MKLHYLLLAALLCLPMVATAATSTDDSVQNSATHNRELKEGDKAPDQYKRDEAAIKDWKAKGLPAPEKESHWVRMGDRYVLVQTTNGVVLAIQHVK